MKKGILLLGILLGTLLFNSCKVITPYYTSMSKISTLRKGDNLNLVNKKLNIEPFEFYFLFNDYSLYEYKYRLANKIINNYFKGSIHKEKAQTDGKVWYVDEQSLFVIFKKGKLLSYITTKGLKDGEFLVLDKNNIKVINKENINNLLKNSPNAIILYSNDKSINKISLPQEKNNKSVDVVF